MTIFKYEDKARMLDPSERLSDVTKLSAHVTRVLGQNPGHTTLSGTCSYLLQPPSDTLAPLILIDTSSPHTAAQYVDLLVTYLHHLGLESGVREIHFESPFALQALEALVPKEPIADKDEANKKGDQQTPEAGQSNKETKTPHKVTAKGASSEEEESPEERKKRSSEDAKLAVLSRCTEDPRAMELHLAEYGLSNWVIQAARERKLPPIEHIILTHRHLDHVGAVPLLLRALRKLGLPPPKIWKLPNPDEAALQADPLKRHMTDQALIDSLPQGFYTPFSPFQPLHPVLPGLMISILDPSYKHLLKHDKDGRPKWNDVPEIARVSVRCLKTPGHTQDSVSLVLCEGEKGVFTGDTVLGEGKHSIEDIASYTISLRTITAIRPSTIYPGHGHQISGVADCSAHLQGYLASNTAFSAKILDTLSKLNVDGGATDQATSPVHPLILSLRDYFKSRTDEATAAKKEEREFLTGVPYVPGKKTRKAPYGTLRWVSEAGTEPDDTAEKGKKARTGMGQYGWGKALPEGFIGGDMRGKDAGQVKVVAVLDDDKEKGNDVVQKQATVVEPKVANELSQAAVNDKNAESTIDIDDGLPDLTAFIKALTDNTTQQEAQKVIPISMIARLLLQTVDEKAMYAARPSILAHLVKLEREGKVGRVKGLRMPNIIDMEVVEVKTEEDTGEEDWWYARV